MRALERRELGSRTPLKNQRIPHCADSVRNHGVYLIANHTAWGGSGAECNLGVDLRRPVGVLAGWCSRILWRVTSTRISSALLHTLIWPGFGLVQTSHPLVQATCHSKFAVNTVVRKILTPRSCTTTLALSCFGTTLHPSTFSIRSIQFSFPFSTVFHLTLA